jgi:hypothetical protein
LGARRVRWAGRVDRRTHLPARQILLRCGQRVTLRFRPARGRPRRRSYAPVTLTAVQVGRVGLGSAGWFCPGSETKLDLSHVCGSVWAEPEHLMVGVVVWLAGARVVAASWVLAGRATTLSALWGSTFAGDGFVGALPVLPVLMWLWGQVGGWPPSSSTKMIFLPERASSWAMSLLVWVSGLMRRV